MSLDLSYLRQLMLMPRGVSYEVGDNLDLDDARSMQSAGLVQPENEGANFYEATPLGLRVIEAALRAANEELGK